MKKLCELINEKDNWVDDVDVKWHPEEGLFTRRDPNYIASYLMKNSKDRAQAMSRLVFYMNRCGDNLTNKTVLNKVKEILKSK
jgi:hypothetical protein